MRHAIVMAAALAMAVPAMAGAHCGPVMNDLHDRERFRLLAVNYYACDAAAREAMLGPSAAAGCSVVFQDLKAYFAPGEGPTAAYLAFKCWEGAHPDVVAAFLAPEG